MNTHYSTVPVEVARRQSSGQGRLLPVVLVVDDEPLIVETLATILNGSGLAALTAEDGRTALKIAELIPPDLLITDVGMPGMNGFELAITISRSIPDCEIILFSGQPSTVELVETYNRSGHDFLTLIKPVHPADLLWRVFERLNRHGWPVPADLPRRRAVRNDAFQPQPSRAWPR